MRWHRTRKELVQLAAFRKSFGCSLSSRECLRIISPRRLLNIVYFYFWKRRRKKIIWKFEDAFDICDFRWCTYERRKDFFKIVCDEIRSENLKKIIAFREWLSRVSEKLFWKIQSYSLSYNRETNCKEDLPTQICEASKKKTKKSSTFLDFSLGVFAKIDSNYVTTITFRTSITNVWDFWGPELHRVQVYFSYSAEQLPTM